MPRPTLKVNDLRVQSFVASAERDPSLAGAALQSLTNCSDSDCCDWTDSTGTCQMDTPGTGSCTCFPC